MNTNLLTTISFGLKRHFKKFRKHLRREALDFKFGNKHTHRNPHAIPFDLKRKLQNVFYRIIVVWNCRRLGENSSVRKRKF